MKREQKTMEDREVIKVPFYNDEFTALGVSPDNTYFEAVALIRSRTGCVIGARTRKVGVSKTALFTQFNNASDEQKKAIAKILGQEQE